MRLAGLPYLAVLPGCSALLVLGGLANCGGKVEPEAAADAGVDPPPRCGAVDTAPRTLARLDDRQNGMLALVGDRLFLGAMSNDPGPFGEVHSIPTNGEEGERLAIDEYLSGPFATDGTWLYFMKAVVTSTGPSSWAVTYPNVVAYRPETREKIILPNPVESAVVSDLEGSGNVGVVWRVRPAAGAGMSGVAAWTPMANAPRLVFPMSSGVSYGLLADEERAYLRDTDDRGSTLVRSIPLDGQPSTTLPISPFTASARLVALDTDRLYLTGDDVMIYRMKKTGGMAERIAEKSPASLPVLVDRGWVYMADSNHVVRAPVSGLSSGNPERVFDADRVISDFRVGGCTLYVALGSPVEVLAVPLP